VLAGDTKFLWDDGLNKLDIDGSATITGDLTVDTTTLVVDATNHRVGMGTASPGSRLDVRFSTNPAINNAVPTNALRVFTSVAQAVDVGGQIGLGGLYNATDFQAFANISGKKENSTSGNNAGYLVIGTCDSGGTMAERARFNSTGAFVLAGGTTGANGIGVAFPLTPSASSDANTLDGYEEGTWTPTITAEFGTIGATVVNSANYTKVGRLVSVTFDIEITSAGTGTNGLKVSLPFSPSVAGNTCGALREYQVTGNMGQVFKYDATNVLCKTDNNLTLIVANYRIMAGYTYFV
jgi:hypothetical protein